MLQNTVLLCQFRHRREFSVLNCPYGDIGFFEVAIGIIFHRAEAG